MDLLDAIVEQHRRRARVDDRLPSLDRSCLSSLIESSVHDPAASVCAVRGAGGVAALAWPTVEHYPADSDKLAYYERDTGSAAALTLRETGGRCFDALSRLLERVEADWLAHGATGANLLWPCREVSIEPALAEHGFVRDACIAFKPLQGPASVRSGIGPAFTVRAAAPADEPVLLRLQEEVLAAHIPHSPFARRVPGVRARFHDRLAEMWDRGAAVDDAPLVLVLEHRGQITAMTECFVRRQEVALDMVLPAGLYGYVNTFGVLPECRGGGAGRLLAESVEACLRSFGVEGLYLYYSYYNSGAMAFWSKLGYSPLWHTYQRRDLAPPAR
ncbi:GNAT family N-acetyltransferase [Micromonospora sp. NPDC047620]|uniref:GNAT family N-acetyltransferase n=1 Tax=Micromonospora sp. NPDC047620 TaxID=3364251 RepID=UPI0037102083